MTPVEDNISDGVELAEDGLDQVVAGLKQEYWEYKGYRHFGFEKDLGGILLDIHNATCWGCVGRDFEERALP